MFKFNLKIILYVIGILLLFNGGLMLLSALTSLLMKDGVSFEIALSAFIVIAIGSLMMIIFRGHKPNIQKREGISYCYHGMVIDGDYWNDSLFSYGFN